VTENPTMRIGDVKIMNNKLVREKPIRREILLNSGDLYSQKKLNLSKKHIFETGLFSSVNIRLADIDTAQHTLDLIVDVRELDMRYLGLKIGFGQDRGISSGSEPYTSIEIEGEWLHRNVLRRGSRLSTTLSNSLKLPNIIAPKTLAEIVYVEPWLWGFRSSTLFRVFMGNQLERIENRETEKTWLGGEAALIYNPNKRFFLKSGIEIQRIIYTDIVKKTELDTLLRGNERAITFNLRRDYRDNFLYPTEGTVFNLNGKIIPSFLVNTQDYYKFETSFSHYINIFGQFVFAYRCKVGWMDAFKELGEIPPWEKYYLGGSTSLRGWEETKFLTEKVVMAKDTTEMITSVGGNIKVLANAEIRFPLFWKLGGEIFIDAGSMSKKSDIKSINVKSYGYNAGIGLTFSTPLGPIRFDYAKVIKIPLVVKKEDRDVEIGDWQIQFSISYAF